MLLHAQVSLRDPIRCGADDDELRQIIGDAVSIYLIFSQDNKFMYFPFSEDICSNILRHVLPFHSEVFQLCLFIDLLIHFFFLVRSKGKRLLMLECLT